MTEIDIGGDLSGILVVGDNNVIVGQDGSSVSPREQPPPVPRPRRRPKSATIPRLGPEPIGRGEDLNQIEGWLAQDLPVEVVGPDGIGKSTLLRALAARRTGAGQVVVYLTASDLGVEDVVQELFQACYDIENYKPERRRLRRLMGKIRRQPARSTKVTSSSRWSTAPRIRALPRFTYGRAEVPRTAAQRRPFPRCTCGYVGLTRRDWSGRQEVRRRRESVPDSPVTVTPAPI